MRATPTLLGLLLCSGAYAAAPTPVCQNQRQCEAMWAAAQTAVSTATGMPIRIVTDSRIETHPATNELLLTGVVTKIPSGQEGYKIVIDLSCHGATQCDDRARAGTELFNTLVMNAGAPLGPMPVANPTDRSASIGLRTSRL
jgi:hypothetical protein